MGAVIVPPYKVTYCKDTELKYAKLLECCPAYGKYPIKLVYYIERDCWGTLVDLQQGLRKREGHLTTPNIHSDKNSTLSKNGWTLPQCGQSPGPYCVQWRDAGNTAATAGDNARVSTTTPVT